jgi:predicted transcriptional regulator YdeE
MKKLSFLIILSTSIFVMSCKNNDMKHETKELPQFYVVGISVRTTNQNGQSQKDLGNLFTKYLIENTQANIKHKESEDTYCVYSDYESDMTGKYTAILGCKVKSLDSIPAGMVGIIVPESKYNVYISTGKLPECVVNTWMKIYLSDIKRKYKADFDLYGSKGKNPANAEVETYLSVN